MHPYIHFLGSMDLAGSLAIRAPFLIKRPIRHRRRSLLGRGTVVGLATSASQKAESSLRCNYITGNTWRIVECPGGWYQHQDRCCYHTSEEYFRKSMFRHHQSFWLGSKRVTKQSVAVTYCNQCASGNKNRRRFRLCSLPAHLGLQKVTSSTQFDTR